MITLNDYLYSGDTIFKILQRYSNDLKQEAKLEHNEIDLYHANFLLRMKELLMHNEFLNAQAEKIGEFYMYMSQKYPFLAFTFRGRIKSLIRTEEKFNGYIVKFICNYYKENNSYPSAAQIKNHLTRIRDSIAYRIVISLTKCQANGSEGRKKKELEYIYEIANVLPEFFEEIGFTAELSDGSKMSTSPLLNDEVKAYYKDYISSPSPYGYQSLHITFFDNIARCYMEIQLRTKEMDDYAEIGPANHLGYEKRQEMERSRRDVVPVGECMYFDEAYERGMKLQGLELKDIDVNMFSALDNNLINDGCGLYKGRLIRPYEHLSRFQNDIEG